MKFKLVPLALVLVWVGSTHALAKELDAHSQDALQKTQILLTSPYDRQKLIEKDKGAALADHTVQSLGALGADPQALYQVSSDIFEQLVKESGGDTVQLQTLILEAQKNPKAFAEKLSARNQDQIRSVASQIKSAP